MSFEGLREDVERQGEEIGRLSAEMSQLKESVRDLIRSFRAVPHFGIAAQGREDEAARKEFFSILGKLQGKCGLPSGEG
jgi:hypothetical protein